MKGKMRVLFLHHGLSTFVKRDLEILKRHFSVKAVEWKRGFGMLESALKIIWGVWWCDASFTWFASVYGAVAVFFSRLFRKKSVIVVAGYDVAKVPELKYGAFTKFKEAIPARYCLKKATHVLVVDESLKRDAIENAEVDGENIEYLPTGYDANYWKPKGEKEDLVLTVASADDAYRVRLKGLDTFVKAARLVPGVPFVAVGVSGKAKGYLEEMAPTNVELIGFIDETRLRGLYQKAKVYCQLSLKEGLPNALCEAMLCGCVPVGTEGVGGIALAIGDAGYCVPYGDDKAVAKAIETALQTSSEIGKKSRERIIERFSMEEREEGIVNLLTERLRTH